MKITTEDIARWLIDTVASLPQAQHAEAADAALDALRSRGLSRDVRTFPHTVRRMLEKRGMVFAEIVTPAEDGEAGHIASAIETAVKKKVSLSHRKDPSLLGGALLSIGDERFDASVRGSLNRFRLSFSSNL